MEMSAWATIPRLRSLALSKMRKRIPSLFKLYQAERSWN